jgi:hypothetical protein
VSQFFDSLVLSLNDLPRPEFCKIKVLTQNKYDFEIQDRKTASTATGSRWQHKARQSYPELAAVMNPQPVDLSRLLYSELLPCAQAYERYLGRIQLVERDLQSIEIKGFCRDSLKKPQHVASLEEDWYKE